MLYTKEDDLKRLDEPDFRENSATKFPIRRDFLMRSCGYYPKFSTYAKLFSNYITRYDNLYNLSIGRPWCYGKDEEIYGPDIDEILLFLKVMHITPNTLTKVVRRGYTQGIMMKEFIALMKTMRVNTIILTQKM